MGYAHHLFIRPDNEEKRTFKAEHPYFAKPVQVVKLAIDVGEHIVLRDRGLYQIFKIISKEEGANHFMVVEVK